MRRRRGAVAMAAGGGGLGGGGVIGGRGGGGGGGGGVGVRGLWGGRGGGGGATWGAGAHEAEMAVFQMPYRPGPQGAARRAVAKVFKSLFVAVLLAAAGVVAMCSFDDSFRRR